MTGAPAQPPAGWYPAPDGSSATWWWDGSRWTQPHHQPSQQPTTTNGIAKLAVATQVLLIICGVMSVITIGLEAFGINAVSSYLSGDNSAMGMITTYDQCTLVVIILSALFGVATGVLWVVWQYRAAKQVVGRTRRSAGWHAGSWFVPFISLWFPYQNISDLWRAVGRARPSWLVAWWLLWIAGNLFSQASSRISATAVGLEQFRAAITMSIAGEILMLAAVPLACLVIRGITQGILRDRSPAVAVHDGLTPTLPLKSPAAEHGAHSQTIP